MKFKLSNLIGSNQKRIYYVFGIRQCHQHYEKHQQNVFRWVNLIGWCYRSTGYLKTYLLRPWWDLKRFADVLILHSDWLMKKHQQNVFKVSQSDWLMLQIHSLLQNVFITSMMSHQHYETNSRLSQNISKTFQLQQTDWLMEKNPQMSHMSSQRSLY